MLKPRCILAVLYSVALKDVQSEYNGKSLFVLRWPDRRLWHAVVKYWFLRVQKFTEKFTSLIWGSEIFYVGRNIVCAANLSFTDFIEDHMSGHK